MSSCIPSFIIINNDNTFPEYIVHTIKQIQIWNEKSLIYFICKNNFHSEILQLNISNLNLIDIDKYSQYSIYSEINKLFILNECMVKNNIEKAVYIEGHNMIYFCIDELKFIWDSPFGIYGICDTDKSITLNILFINNALHINELCNYLKTLVYNDKTICEEIYTYFIQNNAKYGFLKTNPEMVSSENTLFDSKYYGQYLYETINKFGKYDSGYVDNDAPFAVNNLHYSYIWRRDENNRKYPAIIYNNGEAEYKIANLFIYSDNLVPLLSQHVINQGELFQIECDAWFRTDYNFACNPNMVPYINGKCTYKSPTRVFVFGDSLKYFNPTIYNSKYTLVIGNSDENIDERYRHIFDNPNIKEAYCQNLLIEHPKCHILPIGQANRQWPHGNSNLMEHMIKRKIPKTNHIYNWFKIQTNYPERMHCLMAITQKGIPFMSQKDFPEYLSDIASYKYCICPPGNGVDTHRFWECIYLGVIPIVISNPFNERLKREGYNMIILNRWEDLNINDLV